MKQSFSLRTLGAFVGLCLGGGLFACLCLWVSAQGIDWRGYWEDFSLSWLLVFIGLSWLMMLTGAYKWARMSESLYDEEGHPPPNHFFLRHYLWQNWVGQFLPPSLAIMLGRGWASRGVSAVNRQLEGAKSGLVSGFWDQVMEFACLVGMIPACVAYIMGFIGVGVTLALSVIGIFLAVTACYILLFIFYKRLLPEAVIVLTLSVWRVALLIARLVAVRYMFGMPLDPMLILAAAPIVSLVSLLPLVPGNLGIAEWGWVGVMAFAGADPVLVGVYAVAMRVVVMIVQSLFVVLYESKDMLNSQVNEYY